MWARPKTSLSLWLPWINREALLRFFFVVHFVNLLLPLIGGKRVRASKRCCLGISFLLVVVRNSHWIEGWFGLVYSINLDGGIA